MKHSYCLPYTRVDRCELTATEEPGTERKGPTLATVHAKIIPAVARSPCERFIAAGHNMSDVVEILDAPTQTDSRANQNLHLLPISHLIALFLARRSPFNEVQRKAGAHQLGSPGRWPSLCHTLRAAYGVHLLQTIHMFHRWEDGCSRIPDVNAFP